MEPTKISAKQVVIILCVGVAINVIAGVILHLIFKPKETTTPSPTPVGAKQGTTPTVTTTTPPVTES